MPRRGRLEHLPVTAVRPRRAPGPVRAACSLAALLALSLSQSSCCAPAGTRGWARDVTLAPGWSRVRESARDAALDPATWMPAAAALALQIGDADGELSEWAVERAPLFGDTDSARRASDWLYASTAAACVTTALLAPSRCDEGAWFPDKVLGLTVAGAAAGATSGLTEIAKNAAQRMRPDGSNRGSFPSAHASGSAVLATLASRNLDSMHASRGWRSLASAAFGCLAAGTAWARVEGGRHYPSDALAGLALGHFVGAFMHDAFLGGGPVEARALLGRGEAGLAVSWRFPVPPPPHAP